MTPKTPAARRPAAGAPATTEVDALIAKLKHPLAAEIQLLRELILGADASIAEGVKWNAPSFYTSEHFATFHLRASDAVQVVFHLGAKPRPDATVRDAIVDRAALLKWRGPDRATATFRGIQDIESTRHAFVDIVRQWIGHVPGRA